MSYKLQVKLTGEDLQPQKMSAKKIGELLQAIEEMYAAVVIQDNPLLELDDTDYTLGLSAVKQGSYILEFDTLYAQETQQASRRIAQAIEQQSIRQLPSKTIEGLKKVRKITRDYKNTVELWEQNGKIAQLPSIVIHQNTTFDTQQHQIQETTVIYGTVIRVGGEDPPRVQIRLNNNETINCRITKKNQLAIAQQIAGRLYTKVGLRGVAKRNSYDFSLEEFTVYELLPFKQDNNANALAELRELVQDDYKNITDPTSYFNALRQGTDEESA